MDDERIAAVRAFNRFYTSRIGVLRQGLLKTRWTLGEARVIYELAQRDPLPVAELREQLGIDAGYLSRVLAQLERAGCVKLDVARDDRRRRLARLTARGRRAFATLDRRSAEETRALLAALGEADQRRLVGAMATIRDVLDGRPDEAGFELRAPGPGDLGWIVERHGALYAQQYGWDARFETLVAGIVTAWANRHDPEREAVWIAERGGERVGCVMCVAKNRTTAQLRVLLVEPHARGMGIGAALIDACVGFARDAGYRNVVLWTNDSLVDARRLYERAGFELVNEGAHHSFGRDLVEQTWRLELGR